MSTSIAPMSMRALQRADFYRIIAVHRGYPHPMVDLSDYPAQAHD